MRKVIAIILAIVLMGCSAFAEAVRTDDAIIFLNAVERLKQIKSRQSVAEAQEMLAGINSNYNQANMFGMYASAIIDIYDECFDDAENKLTVLKMNSEFSDLLKKYELPDCSVLENYILARREEAEGRYSEALEIYTSMNFLDSLERSVSLVSGSKEQKYQEAIKLYNSEMYVEAAEAFEALGQYKDSTEMVKKSTALISTPSPTPSPSPTPNPTPTPTSIPTPSPAPTPTPTSVSWKNTVAAIDNDLKQQWYEVSPRVYVKRIQGQYRFRGEINDIVDYLSSLDYQDWLDIAVINNENGEYYARVKSDETVATWTTGENVHAYEVAKSTTQISILFNHGILVQDKNAQVKSHPGVYNLDHNEDILSFSLELFNNDHNTIKEEYVKNDAFPNASAMIFLNNSGDNIEPIKMFLSSVVLSYYWSELEADFLYGIELNVA